MIIAVDFDGVLCEKKFPAIGAPNRKLIAHLVNLRINGAKIILWTCRNGSLLDDAVLWCNKQGLSFDAVNENLQENIEQYGGDTRKIFAHVYIDDQNAPDEFMTKYDIPYVQGQTYFREIL